MISEIVRMVCLNYSCVKNDELINGSRGIIIGNVK